MELWAGMTNLQWQVHHPSVFMAFYILHSLQLAGVPRGKDYTEPPQGYFKSILHLPRRSFTKYV
jgi:hypothetical protein